MAMPPVSTKPVLTEDAILAWLNADYALTGDIELLPGESDLNAKLTTDAGDTYVCKVSDGSDNVALLHAQNEVMNRLEQRDIVAAPRVLTSIRGESLVTLQTNGGARLAGRVLTYVPGTVLAKCAPYSNRLIRDLGRTLGRLNEALAGYDHPAFHYKSDWDLARAANAVERYRDLINDPETRSSVDQCYRDFNDIAAPRFSDLRQSVIHNDANDYNVLADGETVTGLIDFGDTVYTYTICDLAIAAAYVVLGASDTLQAIRELAIGYHEIAPLADDELAVLLPLARLRLAVSACMAAHQIRLRPDDPYLSISQQPIRDTLPHLLALDANDIYDTLKEALA